jgi:hypothetical protein
LPDGNEASATTTLTPKDADTMIFSAKDRLRNGKEMPDITPTELHRVRVESPGPKRPALPAEPGK